MEQKKPEAVFVLDDRLAQDTVELMTFPLCTVRLMKDARYPWVILVPRRAGLKEIRDLTAEDAGQLMQETRQVSRCLEKLFFPDKINVGALGNIVSQLHIHIIARYRQDAAWPGPVWGVGKAEPYETGALQDIREKLVTALETEAP